MSRVPSIPELKWKEGNVPYSPQSSDVYYSLHGGLDETRSVFLEGCGLPRAWNGKDNFTVGELGFGTGLNFLALWHLWNEHRPSTSSWLEFVSYENSPLTRDQAELALSPWVELKELADLLLRFWPHRALGVRRTEWPEFGVALTLHIDQIKVALPASRFIADAWLLDGFAPARNPEMWTQEVFGCLAERSNRNTRLATYSVAGDVRRGLEKVGFQVERKPGHGTKRQRLEAIYVDRQLVAADPYGIRRLDRQPKRVAILGAGIAGATLARALTEQSCKVDVFEQESSRSLGASGNRYALVMPRVDATDTLEARILIDAYITARESYKEMPGVYETEVTQLPRTEKEEKKFEKLILDPPLPQEDLLLLENSALLHKRALIVKPKVLIDALLSRANIKIKRPSMSELEDYDVVVIASGFATLDYVPWLALSPKLGQVEYVGGCSASGASALAAGHFGLTTGTERFWGATFDKFEGCVSVTASAEQSNLEGLRKLNPVWFEDVKGLKTESRASVRATTPDRLPLIGAIPDYEKYVETFLSYSNGTLPRADAPLIKGWYISSGFGTRGFTWGPWAASILTAQILGRPYPATESTLQAVSPARQILKRIKKAS